MASNIYQKFIKGISIIEILVVIFILAVSLTSLLGLVSLSLGTSTLIKQTTQANNIAQEAIEAVRNIRDSDWTKLINGNHGLTNTGGYWDFQGTDDVNNGFRRTILIEDVYRDSATDNIESPGDYLDNNTKKVTTTVSWQERGRTHEVKLVTYLTNWR